MTDHPMKSTAQTRNELPSFEAPPITEVVCGVQFKAIEDLSAPHLGLLWQSLQPLFPRYREMPPLPPAIEVFPLALQGAPQLRISTAPAFPRMWFMNEDESQIVQIQRDRLLTNWKKVNVDQAYPRYGAVSGFFFEQLEAFRAFLKHANLSDIHPTQYELTYVNHIPEGKDWHSNSDIGILMPDLAWRSGKRFLPAPETFNWTTSFVLPNEAGRLHITAVNAIMEKEGHKVPLLQLTLTVRGIDKPQSLDNTTMWFDVAREWIVLAFADITGPAMQEKIWRRLK